MFLDSITDYLIHASENEKSTIVGLDDTSFIFHKGIEINNDLEKYLLFFVIIFPKVYLFNQQDNLITKHHDFVNKINSSENMLNLIKEEMKYFFSEENNMDNLYLMFNSKFAKEIKTFYELLFTRENKKYPVYHWHTISIKDPLLLPKDFFLTNKIVKYSSPTKSLAVLSQEINFPFPSLSIVLQKWYSLGYIMFDLPLKSDSNFVVVQNSLNTFVHDLWKISFPSLDYFEILSWFKPSVVLADIIQLNPNINVINIIVFDIAFL